MHPYTTLILRLSPTLNPHGFCRELLTLSPAAPQPSAGFSSVHGGSSAYAAMNGGGAGGGSQRGGAWMRRSASAVALEELLPPDSSVR